MIDQYDMMSVIEKHRTDEIVIACERANTAWPTISTKPDRDTSSSVMGKGSSIALGIALAKPDTKVIVFDGDGSLLMNLGTLATIANKKPKNFYHIVIENGMYATTGEQPLTSGEQISFIGLSKEAGYASTFQFDDLEEFASRWQAVLQEPGPVFISVKTVPNPRPKDEILDDPKDSRRSMPESFVFLRKELGG